MGVISVRLNKDEENILKKLSDYYHADKSTLIKRSLFEFYENMVDLNIVKQFEAKGKKERHLFVQQKIALINHRVKPSKNHFMQC